MRRLCHSQDHSKQRARAHLTRPCLYIVHASRLCRLRILPLTGLTAGSCLGPYEIQSAIGAGGTGEVYKARDTRLDRRTAYQAVAVVSPDGRRVVFIATRFGGPNLQCMGWADRSSTMESIQPSSLEGIPNLQEVEPAEISVVRVERVDTMLSKQRRQERIRHLIAAGGPVADDLTIDIPEAVFLRQRPHVRQPEQRLDVSRRLVRRKRIGKDCGML